MNWREYFETTRGTGVLATADADGVVDVAIYARPHVLADGIGFIMPDRRTHQNLGENLRATYLFIEEPSEEGGEKFVGHRLHLKKTGEEKDTERLRSLRRRTYSDDTAERYLVLFDIEEARPLVGDEGAFCYVPKR